MPQQPDISASLSQLVVGTICGGADGTSGITANPAVGNAFDQLVQLGASCNFEETWELIGCENHMQGRANNPDLGSQIQLSMEKAARYYNTLGCRSLALENADGGLANVKEKSLGAHAKSGHRKIYKLLKLGDQPPQGCRCLLGVVSDRQVQFGF